MNISIKASIEKYKWIIIGIIVIMLVVLLPMMTFADVGNNVGRNRGSGGSGGSYRTNSFELFYLISLILRLGPVGWIIIIVLGILYFKYARGNQGTMGTSSEPVRSYMDESYSIDRQSIRQLIEEDPNFSEQMFISQITNMFMRLQLAWMNKKWEEARPFESDALFNMHHMQLSQYVASKTTNKMEDICVLNTEIQSYRKQGDYEYLDVIIKARFIDYVINDETGSLVKGNNKFPVTMTYRWKMMRKQGVKSTYNHVDAAACPNCGANISINQAGKCDYCNSIVTRGDYDWVLSEIEVISQD
ncbi:MAG: Tim44 domain superfamily protein [Clostridia bacterium]|jgi:hypothetical protein|nr:Tim44 domain superfamily protein [Clostridia bacterium]